MFGAITGSQLWHSAVPRPPGQASSSAKYYRDLATGLYFSLGLDGPGVGPGPASAASATSRRLAVATQKNIKVLTTHPGWHVYECWHQSVDSVLGRRSAPAYWLRWAHKRIYRWRLHDPCNESIHQIPPIPRTHAPSAQWANWPRHSLGSLHVKFHQPCNLY